MMAVTGRAGERLQPPKGLPERETAVWSETVGNRPWDWFGREQVPLLTAYCRHVVYASVLAQALERMSADDFLDENIAQRHNKVLAMHTRETKQITVLAVQMRLTNQSRYEAGAASRQSRQFATESAQDEPWLDAA